MLHQFENHNLVPDALEEEGHTHLLQDDRWTGENPTVDLHYHYQVTQNMTLR